MIITVSFVIGCLLGWYIGYRLYAPERTQINKKGSKNNIQIGTINWKELKDDKYTY